TKVHVGVIDSWEVFIGLQITAVNSFWRKIKVPLIQYPETVSISFCNQKSIWISALEIQNGKTEIMSDNLIVFFDAERVKKYDIGPGNNLQYSSI
ncbi:MAG: hypothetical protein AAGJ82_09910, partial [Bacteroidota bacterium]